MSISAAENDVAAVTEVLERYCYGGAVIEEEPPTSEGIPSTVVVKGYLPVDKDLDLKKNLVNQGLSSFLKPEGGSSLQVRELDEEDWASSWKQYFDILHVGSHLVIKPTWREYSPQPGEIIIELDPGMAFGTGQHPTTRGCLAKLESWVRSGMGVLDLGTGSGILAIAAAKLGAESVLALDTDPIAVKAAQANVRLNSVSQKIKVRIGSLTSRSLRSVVANFDLVVANLTSDLIIQLAERMAAALTHEGTLILGGISVPRLDAVKWRLESVGVDIMEAEIDGEWVTLIGKARTAEQQTSDQSYGKGEFKVPKSCHCESALGLQRRLCRAGDRRFALGESNLAFVLTRREIAALSPVARNDHINRFWRYV